MFYAYFQYFNSILQTPYYISGVNKWCQTLLESFYPFLNTKYNSRVDVQFPTDFPTSL